MADDGWKDIRKIVQEIINQAVYEVSKSSFRDTPKLSPFEPEWAFGPSSHQIQLSKTTIFYAISHLGVLYDEENKIQTFLSGLTNKITCFSHNGHYLAIADAGESDSGIALWDWTKPQLLRFWLNVFPTGTQLIQLSFCGKHLTAISHTTQDPQIIRWAINGPTNTIAHLKPGKPVHLTQSANECIITYEKSIHRIFWSNPSEIQQLATPKTWKKLGLYQISSYLEKEGQIVSGTSCGYIVLWTNNGKYLKSIHLKNSGINELRSINGKVLIGFEDNTANFYDESFRILNESGNRQVSTPTTKLSMDIHPEKPILITATLNGTITAYDFELKTKQLAKTVITCGINCVKFSPSGSQLVIASIQGDLLLIDPILLTIEIVLRPTTVSVTLMLFPNENQIIFANSDHTIYVLRQLSGSWTPCGQFRPHNLKIVGMISRENKLYTVSEDRTLAEMEITQNLVMVETAEIEETSVPTTCTWHKDEIVTANDNYRIRFIDAITKTIIRTVRSPGSSPIYQMLHHQSHIIYACKSEIGVLGNGSCVIAHATRLTAMVQSRFHIFTLGKNDTQVLQWKMTHLRTQHPHIKFSPNIEQKLSRIFENGIIQQTQVVKFFQILGYFPSQFDVENINREMSSSPVDEKTFREVLWNHGPPPEISAQELQTALLSISELQNSEPIIRIDAIISVLKRVQKLSHEESLRCLQNLFPSGHLPVKISLQEFMAILRND